MKKFTTLLIIIFTALSLTACQSKWKIDTKLTPEAKAKIENEITGIKLILDKQVRKDGMGESMAYVNLARAYEKLGNLKKVEKIYKDAIATGINASALHNNLGRLYERVGEYDNAVKQYTILINKFQEKVYLYDITWAYIRAKNFKKAEDYYELWKTTTLKSDISTEKELKKLKEAQK